MNTHLQYYNLTTELGKIPGIFTVSCLERLYLIDSGSKATKTPEVLLLMNYMTMVFNSPKDKDQIKPYVQIYHEPDFVLECFSGLLVF